MNKDKSHITTTAVTGVTAASSVSYFPQDAPTYVPRYESAKDRIEKWFIKPLKELKDHEGFIVLMVLFPLYEKHLRILHGMNDEAGFSGTHAAMKTFAKDVGLCQADAFLFWQHFRNGMLHRALPKESKAFRYIIKPDAEKAIDKQGNIFWISPFALRSALLPKIEAHLNNWKKDSVALPEVLSEL